MKWFAALFFTVYIFVIGIVPSLHAESLVLKNNLQQAKPGDFLVISSNKTLTLMHIYAKENQRLTIEEIALPESKQPTKISWKEWVAQNAPGNTSWVMYEIDLMTGQMLRYYSHTKQNWYEIPDKDNFLSKLLTLKMTKMSDYSRKRVGPKPFAGPDMRPFWQPRLVIEGKPIEGVLFDAWQTSWPRDGSELSNKTIEIYLPKDNQNYPSYFPYWLQINGVAGKAKIRIIDSGSNLKSPKTPITIS